MLQHNHYTYVCQALRRTKSGSCLVKIRQCEVFVSSLQSLQLLLQSWVLAKVRAFSMQIATSLKRPSTHYLGVGAGVSRREEVKKVVRGDFLFSYWVFLFSCGRVMCFGKRWGNQTAHSAVAVFMRNCADMRKLFWCLVTVSVRRTKLAKQDDWESRRPLSILRTRRDRQWALPGHIKPVLLRSHQIQHHAKILEGLSDIRRDPLDSDELIPGGEGG